MFFIAFDEVQRRQQSKFTSFYGKLTFVFKLLFLTSCAFMLYSMITLNGFLFANIPSRTFPHSEFWRIFTAPYTTLDGFYGVISIIIAFWWLLSLFPGYEKKYSSIHLLLEIFVQNSLVQISYCLIVSLLVRNTYFYETYNDYFFSLGWIPMIIIWTFKFTGESMEEKTNFCFLPFLIKNKYLAWVISILMILLTIQKTPLIIATVLGAIQFHLFHRSCIRLPLWLHVCLQKPFLPFTRCFTSFVKTQTVLHNLSTLCGLQTQEYLNEQSQLNPGSQITGVQSADSNLTIAKKQSEIEMRVQNENQKIKQEEISPSYDLE